MLGHVLSILHGLPEGDYQQLIRLVSWSSVRQAVAELSPDIIHLHGTRASVLGRTALLWGRRERRPCLIYTVHGLPGPNLPLGSIIQSGIERMIGPRPDLYLAVSRNIAERIVTVWGASRETVRVIYNGVDDSFFLVGQRRLAAGEKTGRNPKRLSVGLLGRLAYEKGFDLALRAFAQVSSGHPGSAVKVAGDGPCRASLERLARNLGLANRVSFLGHVSDPASFLKSVDILLVPSRSEGFGLVSAEAQASAVPVVVSRSGGLPETVEEGQTGFVTTPGRVDLVAAALDVLMRDDRLRSAMGREAYLRARALFSRGRMLAMVKSVYDGFNP